MRYVWVKWLRTEWCHHCSHESLEIFGQYVDGERTGNDLVWCDYHSEGVDA